MLLFQLMVTPPVVSTGTFVMVIRMLVVMCASCPDLAVVLLKQSEYPAYLSATFVHMFCLVLLCINTIWLTNGSM